MTAFRGLLRSCLSSTIAPKICTQSTIYTACLKRKVFMRWLLIQPISAADRGAINYIIIIIHSKYDCSKDVIFRQFNCKNLFYSPLAQFTETTSFTHDRPSVGRVSKFCAGHISNCDNFNYIICTMKISFILSYRCFEM